MFAYFFEIQILKISIWELEVVDSIVNLSYSSTPLARGVYFMPWMNRDGKFTFGSYYEGLEVQIGPISSKEYLVL